MPLEQVQIPAPGRPDDETLRSYAKQAGSMDRAQLEDLFREAIAEALESREARRKNARSMEALHGLSREQQDMQAKSRAKIEQLEERIKGLHAMLVAKGYRIKPDVKKGGGKKGKGGGGGGGKGKGGGAPARKRTSRVIPDHVDELVEVDFDRCPDCGGTDLGGVHSRYPRFVQEAVVRHSRVTQYDVCRRQCRACKRVVSAPVPGARPRSRFGLTTETCIVILSMMGVSFERISWLLRTFCRVSVSARALHLIALGMAARLGPTYDGLKEELIKGSEINGDETGMRIDGQNFWLWVFVGPRAALYTVDKSRGGSVPQRFLAGFEGCIGSDSWGAWNGLAEKQQRCLIHYMREIDETIKYKAAGGEFKKLARRLLRAINDGVAASKGGRAGSPKLMRKKELLERRIDRITGASYEEGNCRRFVKRLRRERDQLFTFLETGCDYHNNSAERALRPSVTRRNMIHGFRSLEGAMAQAVNMTVKETCRIRGEDYVGFIADQLDPGRTVKGIITRKKWPVPAAPVRHG